MPNVGLGQGPYDFSVTGRTGSPRYQRMLPKFLQTLEGFRDPATNKKYYRQTDFGKSLDAGIGNLSELYRNPGGVNPGLSAAIAPLMAAESDRIQRTGAGQLSSAAGSMARSGVGGGMAAALETAIQRANSRDVASARRNAVGQSEQLRRQDMGGLQEMIQTLLDFNMQSRQLRTGTVLQQDQNKMQFKAAKMAAIASIFGAGAGAAGGA